MTQPKIQWLSCVDPPEAFPPIDDALIEPNGLLAAGGDLSPERILHAYRTGIFPWYESGQPILWWSPDPRCVLRPARFHASRSLRRCSRSAGFEVSFNHACDDVIDACSTRRIGQSGTWITPEMKRAYRGLHAGGWVHSVEVWHGHALIGGIYGVAFGKAFFGESMFSRESNASKIAAMALCRVLENQSFGFLDCQLASPHLISLGAELIKRSEFSRLLADMVKDASRAEFWPAGRIPAVEFA